MDELDSTIRQAINTLNEIPEVRADPSMLRDDSVFVTVYDEDSVGEFFKATREIGADRDAISRDGLDTAVMDGWLEFDE